MSQFRTEKQQTIKGQKAVQHVVRASTQSNPLSKRKQLFFNHKPFRRPWRLSTPSPSRARSRSRSRPPQQTEPDDQESPGGPDRNLPSFTPGEETEENCDPEQGNMDDNSSDQEDVIEDGSTTPRKAVSLAGKKQEKTCDMEAPSYRSLPTQEQRRHRMPSSVMPSFKIPPVDGETNIPPVDGETNIPKLRAAIRGLARCLGADLNSRFDPAYYIKVLEGAHGQLFVKLETSSVTRSINRRGLP